MAAANDTITSFEGKINHVYPTGLKIYLQITKEIGKETNKIDISVSNAKNIVDNFISLANKYDWGRLVFMVNTGTGANNTFRVVEHIILEYIQNQAHGYFYCKGLLI